MTQRDMTIPQRKALENLEAGRPSDDGLRGMSAHGGHAAVLGALARRAWTEWVPDRGYVITAAGRAALKEYKAP